MKRTPSPEAHSSRADGLRSEYRFDYRKSRGNRFAARGAKRLDKQAVVLDDDVAEVFTTPESVNKALRALIAAMPTAPSPNRD